MLIIAVRGPPNPRYSIRGCPLILRRCAHTGLLTVWRAVAAQSREPATDKTIRNNETEGAAWLSNMASDRFHVDIGPPEESPIPGAQYVFPQKRVKIDAVAGFCDLHLAQLDGLVVALDWVANDRHHIWGSAIMVAPGVALTAGHVIDEMRDRGFLAAAGGQLFALSFHADRVELWRADSFTRVDIGDLSLLTLVRSTAASGPPAESPLKFSLARMAVRPLISGKVNTDVQTTIRALRPHAKTRDALSEGGTGLGRTDRLGTGVFQP